MEIRAQIRKNTKEAFQNSMMIESQTGFDTTPIGTLSN